MVAASSALARGIARRPSIARQNSSPAMRPRFRIGSGDSSENSVLAREDEAPSR